MRKLSNPILKSSQYYTRPRIISINTFKILYFLNKNDGVAYFSDIKSYLDRSSSQISQTMKRLLNMDYIESNNSRPRKYAITKLGRKIQRQTIKGIVKGHHNTSKRKNNSSINHKIPKRAEAEEREHFQDILIGFFIELPEMLVALNLDFSPYKYHLFVENIREYLLKYDISL
jgi:DNA-binding MarR family transcriptional regulator